MFHTHTESKSYLKLNLSTANLFSCVCAYAYVYRRARMQPSQNSALELRTAFSYEHWPLRTNLYFPHRVTVPYCSHFDSTRRNGDTWTHVHVYREAAAGGHTDVWTETRGHTLLAMYTYKDLSKKWQANFLCNSDIYWPHDTAPFKALWCNLIQRDEVLPLSKAAVDVHCSQLCISASVAVARSNIFLLTINVKFRKQKKLQRECGCRGKGGLQL
jgi:hypothetical protein